LSIPDTTTKKGYKNFSQLKKNFSTFSPKIFTKISEIRVQIRVEIRFSDPGVKKAPDPGSATLLATYN
jgi:hypothetical protein